MAYTRLLRVYYRREKPFSDAAEACRLIRATSKAQRAAVETVLAEFFDQQADGWHNKRADAEIATYQNQAAHNRSVGNLGGRPKKTQVVSENNPSGSFSKPIDNPNQEPVTKNQEPRTRESVPAAPARARKNGKDRATPLADDFDISDAVSAWATREGFHDLSTHLEAFKNKCRAKGYAYINWDAAFMEAIRADWAGVNKGVRH